MERNKSDNIPAAVEFRIGINKGDGVNIAARLEALSQPNGVCISKSIYDLVVPKTKMTFNDLGVQKVKQNSFHAYDILVNTAQKRKLKSKENNQSKLLIFSGILLLAILVGGYIFNVQLFKEDSPE